VYGRTAMRCKTLINIIGKYNHYSILAAFNLKPEKIVFIRLEKDKESCENAIACIANKMPMVTMVEHVIKEQNTAAVSKILNMYDEKDTFFNLSGGSKLMGLLAFKATLGRMCNAIYIDNDNGKILSLKNDVEELCPIHVELTVEDIVYSTGAEIMKHSTELYDKKVYRELVEFMIKNYDMWKYTKRILRDTHIVKQSVMQPLFIEIITARLSYIQIKALERFFKELSEKQLITDYELYYDHIEFNIINKEAKAFIMCAGSWLEALTYRCIKEMKEVNDAVSGMFFVWDEEVDVHNELDVVAAIDSHLVCISCKDTEKYDVEDLNELEVYADHLGGRKVTKILVSTQSPERGEMTLQRADEMGIGIVVFDGDVASFKAKLHKLLI
jgi:hypothetical protein